MPTSTGGKASLLIVDDTAANIELLIEALAPHHYQMRVATSAARALELLERTPAPDLVLLDVVMPGMDGYELCRQLKNNPATRDIPVIFISARSEVASEERGFNVGGVDYITRPFDPAIVRARVRTHVQLKRRTDLMEQLAHLDGLTGIANRRRFDDVLEHEWRRGAIYGNALSLLLIDVDHFKLYNDHYGHGAGDECLREVAELLTFSLPADRALPARYGGEEFAAILPDCDHPTALALAERLRHEVAARALPHAASDTADHVTISVGCGTLVPTLTAAPASLVELADQALYRAKQAGRDQVAGADLTPTAPTAALGAAPQTGPDAPGTRTDRST